MMELSTAQYVVLLLAGASYGFTKTGILGLSALVVPLMLCVFTPGQALGIALPLLIFADIVALIMLRKSVSWRNVAMALPWALLGVFAGWRLLVRVQTMPAEAGDALLRRLVAGMVALVVVSGIIVRLYRSHSEDASKPPSVESEGKTTTARYLFASLFALIGGLVTMIANNSGPAWVVHLMLFRMDKHHFLGTAAWIIFILNVVKLPLSIQLGYVNMDTIKLNALMMPLVLVGLFAGRWVVDRVSQKWFDNSVQLCALLGALYLLFF